MTAWVGIRRLLAMLVGCMGVVLLVSWQRGDGEALGLWLVLTLACFAVSATVHGATWQNSPGRMLRWDALLDESPGAGQWLMLMFVLPLALCAAGVAAMVFLDATLRQTGWILLALAYSAGGRAHMLARLTRQRRDAQP